MVEWNSINWRKLEKVVYKLQKRIYQASLRGDSKAVRKLEKTLMRSWSAKALAVRKVTQENRGKNTAGVDGVKSLTPKERIRLTQEIKFNQKVKPTRRVWIPKPGKAEKRPLGIPTLCDRAKQALVKLALEPEWEAKFEPNSYGFRPGRSAHDAIEAIFGTITFTQKWVLDADISKCFDKINHQKLLEKINTFPSLRKVIKAWLKAGVIDKGQLFDTEEGTPQGGVISPLLANIALHGIEGVAKDYARRTGTKATHSSITLIRYADDFLVFAPEVRQIEDLKKLIAEWLGNMGLELNPDKTRIAHSMKTGFDFLGFNIQQHKVGTHQSGKNGHGKKMGFKTLIKPSKKAIKQHYKAINAIVDHHKSSPQAVLIRMLNPVISGWCNYYSTVVSAEAFKKVDHLVFKRLVRWAKRRHKNKSWNWVKNKYWHTLGNDNWGFTDSMDEQTYTLINHDDKKIVRHVKIKGNASPFDGKLKYWSIRKRENPLVPKRISLLLKKQKGKCTHCGLFFREDDATEVDHIIPKYKKGKDVYDNLQLLHTHCHHNKTANDICNIKDIEQWKRDVPMTRVKSLRSRVK